MKVWVKLLIGSILGMIIGFLLPNSESVLSAFIWLEKLALGVGRYAVIPVLVFSLTIAVYELRLDGQFWPMVLKHVIFIVAAAIFVIFSGILFTTLYSPERIQQMDTVAHLEILSLNVSDNILELFPSNMFSVLAGSGIYLFPVCVLAFFVGMGLNYDRNYSKPVISLVDSLSRVFYHVASFFTEIIGLILIVLAAFWAVRYNAVLQARVFRDLILLLGLFSVFLCFVILPLLLYFLKPKVNPWRVLYGFLGPAITAFFSGDVNFTIPVLQRHTKENFGIRRRSSALSLSLFSTFCRSGSAMVAASAFIVIIKSYTRIDIPAGDLFLIGFYSFVISFLLSRHPGQGAYIALAILCLYFRGGEYSTGYLFMKPLAFYLIAIGTFIDVMLNAFGTYVLAKTNGFIEERKVVHFI
jgi:Na+/H+-dicarboxylate symporter